MKALIVHIYYLVLLICLSAPTVLAGHSSSQHSAARRSLNRRQADPVEDPVGAPSDSASTVLFPPVSIEPSSTEPTAEPSISSEPASIPSSEPASTPSSVESISVPPSSTIASESEEVTPPPASSSSTSDAPDGGLSSILSSLLSSILEPDPPTSTKEPSSIPTNPPSSTVDSDTPTPTPSTSDEGGITLIPSSIVITLPSSTIEITVVPSSTEEPQPPPSSEPPVPPSSEPPVPPSSEPPVPPSSEPPVPPSSQPPVPPSSSVDPPQPPPSSSAESVSFPSGSSSIDEGPSTVVSVSVTTVISIPSDLSFILTESSLAVETFPTTTATPTLTDPDQATTSVESTVSFTASSVPQALLPDSLPRRVYPKQTAEKRDGTTLISILFDRGMNWPHLVGSSILPGQCFAFMPSIIGVATGVPASEVRSFALEVFVPSDYKGPADQANLRTMYLAYIDSSTVDALAATIKDKNSVFYTGLDDPVARELASHVVSGFNVQSVQEPNGNDNSAPGQSNSGATSNDGKQRQDAIIGVVSALGAVAVLVLVFLVYRSLKRRRELAHRRLSDPPDAYIVGARPDGREFDQDSVGGQRRRSFYFAEDSLRESPQQQNEYYEVARNSPSPGGMRERRVIPNAISAPVLKESSMNW